MSFNYSKENILSPNVTNPIKKDENFFCSLGDNFMLNNDYRRAIKEYLISLMLDKNNLKAKLGASKAYKNLKEYDKAIKHLLELKSIYGFNSEIYYELGMNYLLNQDNVNAQKNFIKTIKLEPDNKSAQIKLALTHELSGESDMAIIVYNAIIEKYPDYIPAYSNLAGIYLENEEYIEAIKVYKKILSINNQYSRGYLGIGLCFDKMGKYINATRFYKKYIALKPNSQTAKSLVGRIYQFHIQKEKNNNFINDKKFRIISNH